VAKRISFPTKCFYCGDLKQSGQGWLQRVKGKWYCQCDNCFEQRKKNEEINRKNLKESFDAQMKYAYPIKMVIE